MTRPREDRHVVQCNYAAAARARAYLARTWPGGGNERIMIVVRSRGGQWIEKWEDIRRLGDFRRKTLPPEHPLYGDLRIWDDRDAAARGESDAEATATYLAGSKAWIDSQEPGKGLES